MFLIPSVDLIVAQGIAVVGARLGRFAALALTLILVGLPTAEAIRVQVIPRVERPFDAHGDLRYDLLDEFGLKAKRK